MEKTKFETDEPAPPAPSDEVWMVKLPGMDAALPMRLLSDAQLLQFCDLTGPELEKNSQVFQQIQLQTNALAIAQFELSRRAKRSADGAANDA